MKSGIVGEKNPFRHINFYQIALFLFLFTLPLENRYSNIGLILLTAAWILQFERQTVLSSFKKFAYIFLILNLIWFLIGLIFSFQEFFWDYMEKVGKYFLLVLLPLLMIPAKNLNRRQLAFSFSGFVISMVLILLISYANAAGQYQAGIENPFNYSVFVSKGGDFHPAYISMFVVCAFFLCLEGLQIFKSLGARIVITAILILFFLSVFVIQARTAILAMAILIPIYALLAINKRRAFYARLVLVISVFVIGTILVFKVGNTPFLLMKERVVNGFTNSLSIRIETWKCALEVFTSNSWIIGVGSGNEHLALKECYYNNFLTRQYFDNYNTHNDFLHILLRNGIIGLLLWIGFLGTMLIRNYQVKNHIGIIFVLLFCISGLTENLLSRIWGILFIGTGIGFCLLSYFNDARFISGSKRITE
ncbi:O-antigen ligase family protein [Muriicola soli]|uniref:O-antigen ligase-related domain-containing protein n=1 Tax=Muriicola soli TaxID=2507538 RepID=A0A411ECV1_9FLAO|nr:O-antigen ligase family protein [Muriicola soli]QBA65404.1 hypothetical protein EQY75_13205 [Muriicola soli]